MSRRWVLRIYEQKVSITSSTLETAKKEAATKLTKMLGWKITPDQLTQCK